ncbi:hypothetical protein BDW72DRAFT_31020 [Aspergillus terricola var. indicus]
MPSPTTDSPSLRRQNIGPQREEVLHSRLGGSPLSEPGFGKAGSGEFAAATRMQSHVSQSLGQTPVGGAEGNIDSFSRYLDSRCLSQVPSALKTTTSIFHNGHRLPNFSANRSCPHELTASRVSTAIDVQEPWGSTSDLASRNTSRLSLHESIAMDSPNLVGDIDYSYSIAEIAHGVGYGVHCRYIV